MIRTAGRRTVRTITACGLTILAMGVTATVVAEEKEPLRPANERFAEEKSDSIPDFQQHVSPLLGRMGCNGRACHGSFQGQGGFRLSLFGYDFDMDHSALAKGDSPRINSEVPEASLMLEKGTLEIPHKGGQRLEPGSWQYHVLVRWIEEGAKGTKKPKLISMLDVEPKEIVFRESGEQQQLRVVARWEDGTAEDVTCLCRFSTNNEEIATIDDNGLVTVQHPGDSHVIAYYDNGVASVQIILPVSEQHGDNYPDVPTPTKIDELVVRKLSKLGIVPSELSGDAEFLRRASLDITGTLPSPTEIESFLDDSTPDKRARKINELLERPAYAAWWATKFCDLTGNAERHHDQAFRAEIAREWYAWMHKRFAENVPYDEIVAGILLATSRQKGQSYPEYAAEYASYLRKEEPANFADAPTLPHYWARRNFRMPNEKSLGVAHAFLGVRLQCAECHKHPFDQWSQQDFKQFTAFFDRVTTGVAPDSRPEFQKLREELDLVGQTNDVVRRRIRETGLAGKPVPMQEVFIAAAPRGPRKKDEPVKPAAQKAANRGRAFTPKLLGGEEISESQYDDPREAVMEWLRGPDNPYFANAIVNRIWANYFGVGIIDPPDDQNLANPPCNPELLAYLAKGFVENKYDMKWLHREIANSRTYQLSWVPNETNRLDKRNFSHAQIRRLPAEVTYDALMQATANDRSADAESLSADGRAIAANTAAEIGRANYALQAFGRPQRLTTCDCEREMEPNLVQSIYLRNDDDIFRFLDRKDGWLVELAKKYNQPVPDAVVAEARRPEKASRKERQGDVYEAISKAETRIKRMEKQGNREQVAELKSRLEQLKSRAEEEQKAKELAEAAAEKKVEKPSQKPKRRVKPVPVARQLDVIREAYLRTVSRPPTQEEIGRARKHVAESEDFVGGMRDVMWALLNTKEFIVNH